LTRAVYKPIDLLFLFDSENHDWLQFANFFLLGFLVSCCVESSFMQVAVALSHACIKVVNYGPEVAFILPVTKGITERHNRHYQAAFISVVFPKISNVVEIGMYIDNIP
jgi:hypothetical protein